MKLMRKTVAVIVMVMLIVTGFTALPFTVSAAVVDSGTTGDCTWALDDEGTLIISGNGKMQDYDGWDICVPWGKKIKSVVIENGVTSIGDNAFEGCKDLTSVTIGNSVTRIGELAFYRCSGLTSITIPDSVTDIGLAPFGACPGLTEVNISDITVWCSINFQSVDSNPLYYAHNLYLNNELVTDLSIPDTVESIGNWAFAGGMCLTSITIPDSVTSIGEDTFRFCSLDLVIICNPGSAADKYAMSENIKTRYPEFIYSVLDDGTFEVTKYIDDSSNVIIPDTYKGKPVTSIKSWLFLNNSNITSVTIPDSVTNIGKGAFYSCVELKTVNMGNNVTGIGLSAFEKCIQLENINLSTNLQTIGDEAFYDCRRLKNLDIPQTVTSIGEEAFTNCRSLTSLEIPAGVNKLGDESSLGSGMFENCQNLKEIKIPESVSYIQSNAFDGCKNLTIVGASGSYAQTFSAENQIQFRAIVDELPVGDANGDNSIDVLDAAAIQKYASGKADLSPGQITAADVNNDGVADILDAAEIQKYAAGKITEFKKKA